MLHKTSRFAACCVVLLAATLTAAQEPNGQRRLSSRDVAGGQPPGPGDMLRPQNSWASSESVSPSLDWSEAEPWSFQVLPEGLLYRSYLAGNKEPRLASQWVHERDQGWLWDLTAGGRVGLIRYGTSNPNWPEGFQLDVEGAAFPRLTLDSQRDLVSADFRGGIPLTYRSGPWEAKFAYYHLSSHLGDEFMLKHPTVTRINYSRDVLVLGTAWWLRDDLRLYGEAGWAFYADEGSDPWEFQFGIDYTPPGPTGLRGSPFLAINGRLREEVDFGGGVTVQAGWQWRSATGRTFRTGLQYFNGKSDQYEFVQEHEELVGIGLWYDF